MTGIIDVTPTGVTSEPLTPASGYVPYKRKRIPITERGLPHLSKEEKALIRSNAMIGLNAEEIIALVNEKRTDGGQLNNLDKFMVVAGHEMAVGRAMGIRAAGITIFKAATEGKDVNAAIHYMKHFSGRKIKVEISGKIERRQTLVHENIHILQVQEEILRGLSNDELSLLEPLIAKLEDRTAAVAEDTSGEEPAEIY